MNSKSKNKFQTKLFAESDDEAEKRNDESDMDVDSELTVLHRHTSASSDNSDDLESVAERKRRKRRADSILQYPEICTTDDLTRQAIDIKHSITNYCLDSKNCLDSGHAVFIVKEVSRLTEIISKLSMENSRLTGRLEERSNIVRKSSQATFAQIAGTPATKVPALSKCNKPVKRPQQIVIVRPGGSLNCKTSEETKEQLLKSFNPKKEKVKIKNVRRIRDNGILIETETKDDLDKIVESSELKKKGFKLETPGKRGPRLLIFDIQKSLTESDIVEAIYDQNPELVDNITREQFCDEFKLKFKVGKRRDDVVNWVAEVTPKLRNKTRKLSRLYIGWQACRVQDFIGLSRCFQCQAYGHIAKYCRFQKPYCSHCGDEGHKITDCKEKNKDPMCASCKRAKKSMGHSVLDKNCPAYKFALEKILNKTDYGL